jgi:hypothetical protein
VVAAVELPRVAHVEDGPGGGLGLVEVVEASDAERALARVAGPVHLIGRRAAGQSVVADAGEHPLRFGDGAEVVADEDQRGLERHQPPDVGGQVVAELRVERPEQVRVAVRPPVPEVEHPGAVLDRGDEVVEVERGGGVSSNAAGPVRLSGPIRA